MKKWNKIKNLPDEAAKHRSNKDTKTWCKGKVDREHNPHCMPCKPYWNLQPEDWYDLVCLNCGKVLDTYRPWSFGNTTVTEKPEWVIKYEQHPKTRQRG